MIHAMPISRNTLFFTHFVDGLIACLLPLIVNLLLLIAVLQNAMLIKATVGFYGLLMLASVMFYSFTVLMCMICGVIYLPPILFLIFMELYECLHVVVTSILGNIVYGYGSSFYYEEPVSKMALWSPLYAMGHGQFAGFIEKDGDKLGFLLDKGFYWYIPAVVVIMLLALLAYKKRPLESWGDFLVTSWLKVFFSIGITGCATSVFYAWLTNYENERNLPGGANPLLVGAFALVCYLLISMIIRKSVHIKRKSVVIPAVATTAVLMVVSLGLQADLFGIERWTPDEKKVESCCVRAFFDRDSSGIKATNAEVIALHKQFLEEKDHLRRMKDAPNTYLVDFCYTLKDGRVITRHYNLPYSDKDMHDKESLLYTLVHREDDYSELVPEMEELEWTEVNLNHEARNGEVTYVELSKYGVSAEELKQAILSDIKDGNLKTFYLEEENAAKGGDEILFRNTLEILIKSDTPIEIECSEVGYGTHVWCDKVDGTGDMSVYFTSKCEHTLKVLEKAGFSEAALANEKGAKMPGKQ